MLFSQRRGIETRWSSFENPNGKKGNAGMTNRSFKGHAFESLEAGEEKTLLLAEGSGVIRRIWITLQDYSREALNATKIEIFWDGAEKAAVDAPLGDFFCAASGRLVPFENELFASPEGRSLVSYVPMPFLKKAAVRLRNESGKRNGHLYYDIDYTLERFGEPVLYFHTFWSGRRTDIGRDFEILPKVAGCGRFLGASVGVTADPVYGGAWWGEGEVKIYLDGDGRYPSLASTGSEDYIGTGWGQGTFCNRYEGCPVLRRDEGAAAFYRLHIPDPVYFERDCRVCCQQIGGAVKEDLIRIKRKGGALRLVSADLPDGLVPLMGGPSAVEPEDERIPCGTWCNFLRSDFVTAAAYFYLDRPGG